MKTIRTLSLILLAAFTLGSASAIASNMSTASNTGNVMTVSYRDHDRDWRRHRVRRWERYRGHDGRWHHRYYIYYEWR